MKFFDFTLKDKRNLINLLGRKPRFYNDINEKYQSRILKMFSIKLINEIILRNFEILDWNISFYLVDNYIKISEIKSENFIISFNDNIINKIVLPKQMLELYEGNGITFIKYIGDNWEKDKNLLTYSESYTSNNFIKYKGSDYIINSSENEERYHRQFTRKLKLFDINEDSYIKFQDNKDFLPFLSIDYYKNNILINNILNNNNILNKNLLQYYYTGDILFDMFDWVNNNIFDVIKEIPLPKKKDIKEIFTEPKKIKCDLKNQYLIICDSYRFFNTQRINNKSHYIIKNVNYIEPEEDIMSAINYYNENYFKEENILNDKFTICRFIDNNKVPLSDKYNKYFKLKLKNYNEVYVVNIDEKKINTIVPINEYKFDYNNPMVIIRRIIDKSEFVICNY